MKWKDVPEVPPAGVSTTVRGAVPPGAVPRPVVESAAKIVPVKVSIAIEPVGVVVSAFGSAPSVPLPLLSVHVADVDVHVESI